MMRAVNTNKEKCNTYNFCFGFYQIKRNLFIQFANNGEPMNIIFLSSFLDYKNTIRVQIKEGHC